MSPLVGWLQLRHKPLRFMIALAGISFAVILIMMQLGFRSALFESAVRYHETFVYDIALFSRDSTYIAQSKPFSIRRLYQALGHEAVEDVSPVYISSAVWKNPWTSDRHDISAVGFNPEDNLLLAEGFSENQHLVQQQNVVLFDKNSRQLFGPVAVEFEAGNRVITEVNNREVEVVGLFELGPSFGINGTIVTGDDNWLRLFPNNPRNQIQLGLIQLVQNRDADRVRDQLRDYLPRDVLVMTKADFVEREVKYWNSATPIGYIFAFGAIMGFVVGAIIVYQILFADVSEHLNEYATLRALGCTNRFVSGIVIQQAFILGVLGYIPGILAVTWLYQKAAVATSLPLHITTDRAVTVFILTMIMCAISTQLALRKVRRLDPADVF